MSDPDFSNPDSETPVFELTEYNLRRRARGAEAAKVKVTWPDGDIEYLWMKERDIRSNIKERGESPGLTAALEAYRLNRMPS